MTSKEQAEELVDEIMKDYSFEWQQTYKPRELASYVLAAFEKIRNEALEEAAKEFDNNIEISSSEAHDAYQEEAHRRGDVRHADDYAELKESTKEWDRVLVRWAAKKIRALKEPSEEIQPEEKCDCDGEEFHKKEKSCQLEEDIRGEK